MKRQLGFPSLFISQSCAETKWPELLRSLGQVVDNKTYTDEEIEPMDWKTNCRLIKADSPTLVRYFEHRFLQFFTLVVKSSHNPIHEVTLFYEDRVYWMRHNTYSLVCISKRCTRIWM